MNHRWSGGLLALAALTLAFTISACAPSQGAQPTADPTSAAPASQAPAESAAPSATDASAPPSQGSYDY